MRQLPKFNTENEDHRILSVELFYCMSLVSCHVLIDDETFLNVSIVIKFSLLWKNYYQIDAILYHISNFELWRKQWFFAPQKIMERFHIVLIFLFIETLLLKVSLFQKDFLVSSFGPKIQRKCFKDFCPSLWLKIDPN